MATAGAWWLPVAEQSIFQPVHNHQAGEPAHRTWPSNRKAAQSFLELQSRLSQQNGGDSGGCAVEVFDLRCPSRLCDSNATWLSAATCRTDDELLKEVVKRQNAKKESTLYMVTTMSAETVQIIGYYFNLTPRFFGSEYNPLNTGPICDDYMMLGLQFMEKYHEGHIPLETRRSPDFRRTGSSKTSISFAKDRETNPGAIWWHMTRISFICKRSRSRRGFDIVLCADPGDKDILHSLRHLVQHNDQGSFAGDSSTRSRSSSMASDADMSRHSTDDKAEDKELDPDDVSEEEPLTATFNRDDKNTPNQLVNEFFFLVAYSWNTFLEEAEQHLQSIGEEIAQRENSVKQGAAKLKRAATSMSMSLMLSDVGKDPSSSTSSPSSSPSLAYTTVSRDLFSDMDAIIALTQDLHRLLPVWVEVRRRIVFAMHAVEHVLAHPFFDEKVSATFRGFMRTRLVVFEDRVRRAKELTEQTNVLISLILNLTTLRDARHAMEQNQNSIEMQQSIQRITVLTFLYLPLTFISSCFGMNVTEINGSTPSVWIYVVLSVGFTTLTFAVLYFWSTYASLKRHIAESRAPQSHELQTQPRPINGIWAKNLNDLAPSYSQRSAVFAASSYASERRNDAGGEGEMGEGSAFGRWSCIQDLARTKSRVSRGDNENASYA